MIIGLVGKPASGKSSFFKAATLIDVKITGIPFCTIEPNVGIGYVIIDCVCKEFGVKCSPRSGGCEDGKRYVPVKLIDVGGLIPGSHLGKGIGNKFLDDLRQASVLIQTVDCSGLTDSEGKPTHGYDPATEIKFLEEEIDLWFAEVVRRALQKFERKPTISRHDLVRILLEQLSGLEVRKNQIELALEKAFVSDVGRFAKVLRRISKPILIAANKIDLKEAQENFEKLKGRCEHIVPTSALAEIALRKAAEKGLIDYFPGNDFAIKGEVSEEQKGALQFIKGQIIQRYGSTGVQDCLNRAVFDLLGYIAVFPVADINKLSDKDGRVLPDVFLVPKETTVRELAYKIHTEIGERFICGIDARTKQKLSADHKLRHRDVIEIAFKK